MKIDEVMIYFVMFFFYCMIGWVWESIYMSVIEKRIQNRGFLHGPYIPIYGFAGIIMNFTFGRLASPILSVNTIIIYVVAMVCATTLELITATLAEKFLHRALWDYTIYKINYKGKICLIASLFWGLAGTLFVQVLNPKIYGGISGFKHELKIVIISIMATLMLLDLAITVIKNSKLPVKFDARYQVVNGRWEDLMDKVIK